MRKVLIRKFLKVLNIKIALRMILTALCRGRRLRTYKVVSLGWATAL